MDNVTDGIAQDILRRHVPKRNARGTVIDLHLTRSIELSKGVLVLRGVRGLRDNVLGSHISTIRSLQPIRGISRLGSSIVGIKISLEGSSLLSIRGTISHSLAELRESLRGTLSNGTTCEDEVQPATDVVSELLLTTITLTTNDALQQITSSYIVGRIDEDVRVGVDNVRHLLSSIDLLIRREGLNLIPHESLRSTNTTDQGLDEGFHRSPSAVTSHTRGHIACGKGNHQLTHIVDLLLKIRLRSRCSSIVHSLSFLLYSIHLCEGTSLTESDLLLFIVGRTNKRSIDSLGRQDVGRGVDSTVHIIDGTHSLLLLLISDVRIGQDVHQGIYVLLHCILSSSTIQLRGSGRLTFHGVFG